MSNTERDAIDISPYRWWTFAKDEGEARQIIRQARESGVDAQLPRIGSAS